MQLAYSDDIPVFLELSCRDTTHIETWHAASLQCATSILNKLSATSFVSIISVNPPNQCHQCSNQSVESV